MSCPATDSAGKSPSADAANYPCPPTAAQQAAGDTCTLTYGDQANNSASAAILLAGETPPNTPPPTTFKITTTSLPDATRGVAYTIQLQATRGATPYRWQRSAGTLPKGLKVHSNGTLSGTPKAKDNPGTFTFTAQATTHKSKGNPKITATQSLTLRLN